MLRKLCTAALAACFLLPSAAHASYDFAALNPPPLPPPTTFASDSFTDAANANLAAHAGETGGWAKNTAGSTSGAYALITGAGRARQSSNLFKALYYSTAVPASADYNVAADTYVASALDRAGVVARESTTADTGDVWSYDGLSGNYYLQEGKAGAYSTLCSYPALASVGSTHTLELDAQGSSLTAFVDGTQACSGTSTLTDAGRPGLRFYSSTTAPSDTTGIHLDNFQAIAAATTAPPVTYNGLRLDRTWNYDGSQWAATDTAKSVASPNNFANAPLPDNTALDTGTMTITVNGVSQTVDVNPATPNEVQRQADAYGTYLNRASYTAPITVVPADTPLQPVWCQYGSTLCVSQMREMTRGLSTDGVTDLHGGFPIPDGFVPPDSTKDTDSEVAFYQPDKVISCAAGTYTGRLYEGWKFKPYPNYDSTQPVSANNPKWQVSSAGRVTNLSSSPGHYKNWTSSGCNYTQPGSPDSTYQGANWGTLASHLFIPSDEVSREDCRLEQINHAVGLLMNGTHQGFRWPATGGDGSAIYSYRPVIEGMRLRFPPGLAKPAFSNRFEGMLFDAAQKYGLAIDDNTAASVGVRVEPETNGVADSYCSSLYDGQAGYNVLSGFPWSKLQVLATGSDGAPNPLAP